MKIYYRKMKRVSRENEEERVEPAGPWRLALGGSPVSLELKPETVSPACQRNEQGMDKKTVAVPIFGSLGEGGCPRKTMKIDKKEV